MEVIVDQNRCVSAGQCVLSAPEVFDQDEQDGVVVLLIEKPPKEFLDAVRKAAALCPSSAITVAKDLPPVPISAQCPVETS